MAVNLSMSKEQNTKKKKKKKKKEKLKKRKKEYFRSERCTYVEKIEIELIPSC